MEVSFLLTDVDSLEAKLVARRFRPGFTKWLCAIFVFAGVASVLVPLTLYLYPLARGYGFSVIPSIGELVYGHLGVILLILAFLTFNERSFKPPVYSGKQTLAIDENGLTFLVSNRPRKMLQWARVTASIETDQLFLLHSRWPAIVAAVLAYKYSAGFLYVVPKRAFEPHQLTQFRDLLGKHCSPAIRES